MTTLNTKKIDEMYEYDPFSEYRHSQEIDQQLHSSEPTSSKAVVPPLEPKEQLLKNIDDMFDGADFVLNIADKFFKRLGGMK